MYIVKWVDGNPDGLPYMINAGTRQGFNAAWTSKQSEARRFATMEEAQKHVAPHPWLRQKQIKILRLKSRQPAATMPPMEPPPRLPPDL